MNGFLMSSISFGIMFTTGTIGWYIYRFIQTNINKKPELVEEINKARVAKGKQPLTAEKLHLIIRRENILFSMLFGVFVAIGYTLLNMLW